jgi:Zn-dependent M28 family amino/carboxypeptidase
MGLNHLSRQLVAVSSSALLLGSCVASADTAPPVHPLDALSADSATILDQLRFLSSDAMGGRAAGTEGSAAARGFLVEAFQSAGIPPLGIGLEQPFTWTGRGQDREQAGVNVVGLLRGAETPERYIVLSGHYDHVGIRNGEIFNGADDNASGAIGILALARALRGYPLRHSLVVAAWDAEERGLQGARAFVSEPGVPLESVAVNLNLDMVARTSGLIWAGGASHTPALWPILEAVAAEAPLEMRLGHDRPDAPEGDDWTRSSDHGAFHAAGVPFVYLGVEDHDDYHRPTDDFENVVPGEYMNALRVALMTLLALDERLSSTPEPGS